MAYAIFGFNITPDIEVQLSTNAEFELYIRITTPDFIYMRRIDYLVIPTQGFLAPVAPGNQPPPPPPAPPGAGVGVGH